MRRNAKLQPGSFAGAVVTSAKLKTPYSERASAREAASDRSMAMTVAVQNAGVSKDEIGYLALHGRLRRC